MVLKVNPLRHHPSTQANPILQSFAVGVGRGCRRGRGGGGGRVQEPRSGFFYCGRNAETPGRSTLQPVGNGRAVMQRAANGCPASALLPRGGDFTCAAL